MAVVLANINTPKLSADQIRVFADNFL